MRLELVVIHSQLGLGVCQGAVLHNEAHGSQQDNIVVWHGVIAIAVILLRLREGKKAE